jgi:hypothetical protein
MDPYGFDIANASRLGLATPNGFEGRPEHDAVDVKMEVSMNKMNSECILDVEALEEARQLLKVGLLHIGLIPSSGRRL